MTTRSVEYTREVTEVEDVTVCDYCGSEIEDPTDDNTFSKDKLTSHGPVFHYHEDCAEEASLDESEPVTVGEVAERTNNTDFPLCLMLNGPTTFLFMCANAMFGIGLTLVLTGGSGLGAVLLLLGTALSMLSFIGGRDWADRAVEDALSP